MMMDLLPKSKPWTNKAMRNKSLCQVAAECAAQTDG